MAGGFIGFAFADFQCEGACGAHQGVGAICGALLGAAGVAVVSVLTLKAMGEWGTIQGRDEGHEIDRNIS
ncbi:MAG: hypothetical protein EDR02_17220 [Actinobacteria bacterium]|nr:MAG: hypothetical protein EDR02_17220 [Actinomycetota bacterium]RIK03640.1 MAG: hypothetical protein DCC48_15915 [Acidobacteriota bacterium]